MNTANGIVNVINAKEWKGKMLYGFALKGQDGFYGLGEVKPTFEKGAEISFQFEDKNGRRNVDPNTVTVRTSSPPVPGPAGMGRTAPAYDSDIRQKYITWQASRNAAIEAFPLLLAAGAIVLPKSGAPKIYEATMAHINEITTRFYQETFAVDSVPTKPEDEEPPAFDEGSTDGDTD